jgi:hypothetical protein
MRTKFTFTIVLFAVLVFAAVGTAEWVCGDQKECGLIGTWTGWADHPWLTANSTGGPPNLAWTAIHTAGSKDANNGEMLLNWVSGSLVHCCGGDKQMTLTPGHGVWELIGKGKGKGKDKGNDQYKYTWYAFYVDDATGIVGISVRVSGIAAIQDCNTVSISYNFDIFDGVVAPQDMTPDKVLNTLIGIAGETRVPLVTP